MGRSTVHYADSETNIILKRLHNKLRPAGTPVERVEYIIELLLLRIFEAKIKQDDSFSPLRKLFEGENYRLLFSHLLSLTGDQILSHLNKEIFPFYAAILSKAGKVITGNMPTKMQDQLVLMEEVFANSNFTNNVKGGVIAEVIGLVNEIDEARVLKTDLLGDAIESALSETGGTKDLGLFRTPDHIRQMMVEMVEPDFTDTIFDPACGTAGFLFDAYEYVIEKSKLTRKFPTEHIANQFYRVGLGGIEYQGRIRKMAAVNMYIRGLNPHNIDQGDSLKMYDPPTDAGSKSIVIANPPFGAERDQPAYPNVWEEYPKESETTILFVKLMFDLLKVNGRCAVVVSEGFLTWGQNSACALRKILLDDANLRAVISLPQGVFVSKGGQGAKTSILYFEKGQPTDFVWYYKIENDGFSMGTNRKPIEGSQIPELLNIFKEVKQGRKPQDTKYSFCVSKEQIETLDPRSAERIRKEVREKTKENNVKKRANLLDGLNNKLESKKISKELYDEKLWQYDNVVESQIENEMTKAIEKAHDYHFNLQNYRSSLSAEQIQEWKAVLDGVKINNGSTIDKRYQELYQSNPQGAFSILASCDSKDALQIDIAREYLSTLEKNILGSAKKLARLEEILRKGHQYPLCEIGTLVVPKYEKIKKDDFTGDFDVVEKISFGDGLIHFREKRETGMDLYKAEAGDLITSKINVHQGAMALSPKESVCSTHYQVYSVNQLDVNSKYLLFVLRSVNFLETINIEKAGGIKNEAGSEFLSKFKIPLPPPEVQDVIVSKLEKQRDIIEGSLRIESAWFADDELFSPYPKEFLSKLVSINEHTINPEKTYGDSEFIYVDIESIDNGTGRINYTKKVTGRDAPSRARRIANNGDVIISTVRPYLKGFAHIAKQPNDVVYSTGYAILSSKNKEILDNKFLFYLFFCSDNLMKQMTDKMEKGSYPSINQGNIENFKISLPPLEFQKEIVGKLDRDMQALEGVRLLKSEAEKRIDEILAGVWGKK